MEKKKIELGFAGGKDGDKGGLGSLGWACHTAIFKMDNHMYLCSILCESLDGSRVDGRMDTCIHNGLSPFAVHMKLLQHC